MSGSSRRGAARIHPTALIEEGVEIGNDTAVWDAAHIRRGARIGRGCIVGEKTTIGCDVRVGNLVKINTGVQVCAGVIIEDLCMIGAHAVFTNERYPRAFNADLAGLRASGPTEDTLETRVCRGATVGANATIGPGTVVGRFAMVGMASAVTHDVPEYALVCGNPARLIGWVCVCGRRLSAVPVPDPRPTRCETCGRHYAWDGEPDAPHPGETRPPHADSP